MIVAIVLAVILTLAIVGIGAAYFVLWYVANKATFKTSQGVFLHIDQEIKGRVNLEDVDFYIQAFIENMTPVPFHAVQIKEHFSQMSVLMRGKKISTTLRGDSADLYNGLALSVHEVEIACDSDFWVDGKLRIEKTALGYELLNTCIEAFAPNGYYVALAEGFLNPANKTFWGWFVDNTGDNVVNDADVKSFMEIRKYYDSEWKRAKASISECMWSRYG